MSYNEIKNSVFFLFSLCGTGLVYLLGGWDTAVQTLIIIMAIDYTTGLLVAGVFKRSGKSEGGALDSKAGFAGLMKKVAIILAVLMGAALDRNVGDTSLVRNAIIIFFSANEGLSVVENFALMGIPFPDTVKNALEQMKNKDKKEN